MCSILHIVSQKQLYFSETMTRRNIVEVFLRRARNPLLTSMCPTDRQTAAKGGNG